MPLVAHTLQVEADRPTHDFYAHTPTPDGDDCASEPPKVVTVENRRPGTAEGILDLFSKYVERIPPRPIFPAPIFSEAHQHTGMAVL